jgi:hypothetical protein
MPGKSYSDEEMDIFIQEAQDVGIGRAQRNLGYPNSWATAHRWITARGIKIDVDSLKARSKSFNEWYETEELLLVAQAGMDRIHESLHESVLTPDEIKKLAEAYQKYANTWMLLKGKSTNINEHRTVGEMDMEIKKIIEEENMRNETIEANGQQ